MNDTRKKNNITPPPPASRKWARGIGLALGTTGLLTASYEVFCPRATFLGKVTVRGPADTGAVALVFHKMPNQFTDEICQALHELEIPATFFIIGERTGTMPHAVRAMRPFEIGVHAESYTPLVFRSQATIRALVYLAAERARQIQDRPCRFIMPPYGWKGTGLLATASAFGMKVVNPSRHLRFTSGGPLALHAIDQELNRLRPGDILLISPGNGLQGREIPELLGYLVDGLKEKGLSPWGLNALLHSLPLK